jgi:hypothetical protein
MENHKEQCLDAFLKEQNPVTAYNFVLSCRDYIINICKTWREPNLTDKDKIRELICEVFLILLENFKASKVTRRESLLTYIHYRLKQVVKARGRDLLSFEKALTVADNGGRYSFTTEKLAITKSVYGCLRRALLTEQDEDCAFLVFLFVHIYPQSFWASRQLIEGNVELNVTLIERYRKKLQRFNLRLRRSIELNADFDWKEIFTWSRGERSHLAWKLICVSPNEVELGLHRELDVINRWREGARRDELASFEQKQAAKQILSSMRNIWAKSSEKSNVSDLMVSEEQAEWGTPRDMLEIFLGMDDGGIGTWNSAESLASSLYTTDALRDTFSDLAKELADWFEKLARNVI